MDAPKASNKRIFITAGPVFSQQISEILRSRVPGAEERTPEGEPGKYPKDGYTADASLSRDVLGLEYRSVEETFEDLGRQLLEIERGEYKGLR
jgi:hypothetical protein